MSFSYHLEYQLEKLSEADRRYRFAGIVELLSKQTKDVESWNIHSRDSKKYPPSESDTPIALSLIKQNLIKHMENFPSSNSFDLYYCWDYWSPIGSRNEKGINYERSYYCDFCDYYGLDAGQYEWDRQKKIPTKILSHYREDSGDIRINFREPVCLINDYFFISPDQQSYLPYDNQGDKIISESFFQKEKEDVENFKTFLHDSIQIATPENVVLDMSEFFPDRILSTIIYHQNSIEFLKDLVYAILRLHDYLVNIKSVFLIKENINQDNFYFNFFHRQLRKPENLINDEFIRPLIERSVQTIGMINESYLKLLKKDELYLPLLQLGENWILLKNSIQNAKTDKILEIIGTTQKAELTRIGEGHLLEHRVFANRNWNSVYVDLINAVLEGSFL